MPIGANTSQNRAVPSIVNLARYALTDYSPETISEVEQLVREVVNQTPVEEVLTFWLRVTGEDLMALTCFPDLQAVSTFEQVFVNSHAWERIQKYLVEAPDVDRFEASLLQGIAPGEPPTGQYCSTNYTIPEPGYEQGELQEARYIMDSLWQIDGFTGAAVGRSLVVPGRLESVAFWRDGEAAEKAIPIRVDTNLRMYRRLEG